eukprot:CAMPEP_0202894832 /NCGR_PEP_ID=MMETSP1392-20130828/4140_1 /ASSEMBLY_ACC=CAM_ASM_000868 /TAXON_ID=225041 /ORGANISM="Chlamydomonas chlamydogama, Strain SAG 11-48b" /LENGTH=516 /DNA_ID=CAMNT_0049579635 /DNA_START=427 /DNA_END=1974 /DNA_ORIENTATION=-
MAGRTGHLALLPAAGTTRSLAHSASNLRPSLLTSWLYTSSGPSVQECCSVHSFSLSLPHSGIICRLTGRPVVMDRRFSAHASSHTQAATGQAASAQSPEGGNPGAQPPRAKYSPLHLNVEQFCQQIVPTESEKKVKAQVVEMIRQCTFKAFPDMRQSLKVEVFGSFANGLSTWNSDVDLVVTGLLEPDRVTGGYDMSDRGRVTARLRKITEQLRRHKKLDIKRLSIISRARIPIIKLRTRSNVAVDISISDDTGPRAARYMQQQCRAYPPLKPLTLVLKAYLKSLGLNDVATGGLSSYSLCNMVIAHLQEELRAGRDIYDLGETLYSFLLRYGEEFDYEREAISVSSGGVVPKASLSFAMESARYAASRQGYYDGAVAWYERLCVDCPLSGRDVSNGTYRIDVVRSALFNAARKLEALARGRKISDTSINYLQALFDVNRVLKRSYIDDDDDPFFKIVRMKDPMQGGRPGGLTDEEEGEEVDLDISLATTDEERGTDGEEGDDEYGDLLEREPSRQ